MNCTASRHAIAGIVALVDAPSCRRIAHGACRRRAAPQSRAVSTTPRRWQQPAAAAAAAAAPKTPSASQAAANAAQVANELSPSDESEPLRSLTEGLDDPPPVLSEEERQVDWTRSFHGLSSAPFTKEQSEILQQRLDFDDIEIKPDGIVYLPEIKYRRILNKAFGPGGWGLAPRGETIVTGKIVTREYGLVAGGRLISIARGEQQYFDPDGIPTATEGCKSNALMRCCKDLGIASELWDPRFIRKFMAAMGKETMVEHVVTKKRRKHWMRKDDEVKYPLKEVSFQGQSTTTGSTQNAGVAAKAASAYKSATASSNTPNTTNKAPLKKATTFGSS